MFISDIINQFNNKGQIPFLTALWEERDTAMMGDNPVLTKPCFDRNIKSGKPKGTPEAAALVFQGDDDQAPLPVAITARKGENSDNF